MELAQPKSFGVFDNHDCGIRHIYTHFNNCSGNQNIDILFGETSHNAIFIVSTHTAVKQTDPNSAQIPMRKLLGGANRIAKMRDPFLI